MPLKQQILEARTEDAVLSKAGTGKSARVLRNKWTQAWEQEGAPKPLGMPLQGMVTMDAISRTHRYATPESQKVGFNPVGQVVGQINEVLSTRELIVKLVDEYLEATERLEHLAPR